MDKMTVMLMMAIVASATVADVKIGGIFSDNMVLQRDRPIPVCGVADPGEEVIDYAGRVAKAKAGADGSFRVILPPLKVEKSGRSLVIAGRSKVVLTKVVVGDVWSGLCPGSSMPRCPSDGASLTARWKWRRRRVIRTSV